MTLSKNNNNSVAFWAIIPAAGVGHRMGAGIAKQYMPLADSTVIQESMSCFLRHPKISAITIALHAEDQSWSSLDIPANKPIYTVIGGVTRAHSVQIALQRIKREAKDDDFVLVHDAARPCLQYSDLDSLLQKLVEDKVGGILAMPVSDTIKQANAKQKNSDDVNIASTIDRTSLWKAYTPQMFRVATLDKALKYCFKNNIKITDEASAVEALGLNVKLILGREDNIKITRADDIALAEAIIKSQKLKH